MTPEMIPIIVGSDVELAGSVQVQCEAWLSTEECGNKHRERFKAEKGYQPEDAPRSEVHKYFEAIENELDNFHCPRKVWCIKEWAPIECRTIFPYVEHIICRECCQRLIAEDLQPKLRKAGYLKTQEQLQCELREYREFDRLRKAGLNRRLIENDNPARTAYIRILAESLGLQVREVQGMPRFPDRNFLSIEGPEDTIVQFNESLRKWLGANPSVGTLATERNPAGSCGEQ